MKKDVHVAIAQVDNAGWLKPRETVEKMVSLIRDEALNGPLDLIVFPELIVQGYVKERDPDWGQIYSQLAEPLDGLTVQELGKASRESKSHVIFGMARAHPTIPGVIFNSAVLLGPDGVVLHVHDKAHIPGEENHYFAAGQHIAAVDSDVGKIGMSICYEGRYPEVARVLALQGAEIYVNIWARPLAPGNPVETLTAFAPMRASENRFYVISCNRAGKEASRMYQGCSAIAEPIGRIVGQMDEREGVLRAALSADKLYWARTELPIFADRRPDLYSTLIQPLVTLNASVAGVDAAR